MDVKEDDVKKGGEQEDRNTAADKKAFKKKTRAGSAAREISYTAMFVAVITVCAWITIPFPGGIPFTLQTLGVCLAAGFLGWKRGLAAVAVYIALGLCGVPVFSGFTAGAGKLASVTGGYLAGFVFTALVVGLVSDYARIKNDWLRAAGMAAGMAAGVALCYFFGTLWFMFLYNAGAEKAVTFAGALMTCVVPYLLPDALKIACAAFLVSKLKKYMRLKG